MVISREQFDWDSRIKYLLKDSFTPKTFDNYKKVVGMSLDDAYSYLENKKELNPTIETIKTIHALSFGEVYKFSGKFRDFNEEISIGRDGGRGAYYSQISEELNLLSSQTKELLQNAKNEEDKGKLIAFYHIRYVKIHPFLDGNGRTGRVILDYQVKSLLNKTRKIDFTHTEYIKGITEATSTGSLKKLVTTLTGVTLSKDNVHTPYSLDLNEIVINKDVGSGVKLKVPCGDDVELAQEIEVATMTDRLKKAVKEGTTFELGLKESTKTTKAILDLDIASMKRQSQSKGVKFIR